MEIDEKTKQYIIKKDIKIVNLNDLACKLQEENKALKRIIKEYHKKGSYRSVVLTDTLTDNDITLLNNVLRFS